MITRKIVLVGNPNVGKSAIFNNLSRRRDSPYAVVSNYPGTTVEIIRGKTIIANEPFDLIDTPGVNSLFPHSEDEEVTRDILVHENPEVVVCVGDSKNLTRSLLLFSELAELNLNLVLCLNMADEARQRKIFIDEKKLADLTGVPVVSTVGITGEGINKLKEAILNARPAKLKISYPEEIQEILKKFPDYPALLVLNLISGDKKVLTKFFPQQVAREIEQEIFPSLNKFWRDPALVIFSWRHNQIATLVLNTQHQQISNIFAFSKLDYFLTQPPYSYFVLGLILFFLYEFVGVFASGVIVDLLENHLFGKILNPFFVRIVQKTISIPLLADFLVGEYGIITMALTYAFSIIFPIVAAFFLAFSVLEDSGYLPRLALLLDNFLSYFGLNGKAVLPLILGLGCDTMATLTTRILDSKRDRFLVTLLLALSIPCSAQLGTIMGMLSSLGIKALSIWFASIFLSFVSVGYIANKIFPGFRTPFILEIPPLRLPLIKNILIKVKARLLWYLKEAVPLFILGTALLFVLDKIGFLVRLENRTAPILTLVGLPLKTMESFILGFLRRDYGAAGLFQMAKNGLLNSRQIIIATVMITLFVPCLAQFLVMIKERGFARAMVITTTVMLYAFIFGIFLNLLLP